MSRAHHQPLHGAKFRKSSYSTSTGDCVEIGRTADLLGVRDSKQLSQSPVLAITAEPGQAFLDAVKIGRFDL